MTPNKIRKIKTNQGKEIKKIMMMINKSNKIQITRKEISNQQRSIKPNRRI